MAKAERTGVTLTLTQEEAEYLNTMLYYHVEFHKNPWAEKIYATLSHLVDNRADPLDGIVT